MIPGSLLLVSSNPAVTSILRNILAKAYDMTVFSRLSAAFDHIYNDIPDLLLADLHGDPETLELLRTLKEDPLFTHLPVLAILDRGDARPDWQTLPVEDYVWREDLDRDALLKVELCLARAERIVETNPLTRLPGNISINRQIQNRLDLGIPFALAYADLDHFKPFNDKYGFSRGDEVIKITGRLMLNIVRNIAQRDYFVGHIGGDDFVCIMDPELIEATCQDLIEAFDRIIPSFYDPEDREAGHIQSTDRKGHVQRFPMMAISIGVTYATKGAFTHYGAITSIASEMKHQAKKESKSCYRIDRRMYP
ncbi:MAG: diguanylate cyclase [Pseudomonadota bacterium]|nr:diguanylate cyclase [Pseudomonadota bacterium]